MNRLLATCGALGALSIGAWLAWSPAARGLTVPPSDIIFSHRLHVAEGDIECITCHGEAETSTAAADRLFPTMEVCSGCHDVEDDEQCGMCHRNPDEPGATPHPERTLVFNHQVHREQELACDHCHRIGESTEASPAHYPAMGLCFDCHDGSRADAACALCHGDHITLGDIHPLDWSRTHGERAAVDRAWCDDCHRSDHFCLDCHRGDNVTGSIHELNYVFTHGLDANSKEQDCRRCHDREAFCVGCHEAENRIPLLHSSLGWLPEHGEAARDDVENCAACHDTGDPTCARAGCHGDRDGLRGTDPPIHRADLTRFDGRGPWHDDAGYFCFDCHASTREAGDGFCGYCHGDEGD